VWDRLCDWFDEVSILGEHIEGALVLAAIAGLVGTGIASLMKWPVFAIGIACFLVTLLLLLGWGKPWRRDGPFRRDDE
jgi:hypothetical protein